MENSVVFARKKFTMDKFISQAKLTANSKVKKILSSSARSSISTSECSNGMVTVGGKVFVNVVYLNVEDVVERTGAEIEFIEKQQTNYALEELFVTDEVKVESQNSSSSEIMLTLSHSATVSGVYKYEIANFEESENDFVLSKNTFKAAREVVSASDNFVVAEECESNIKNMQILHANAHAVIEEVTCTLDKVVLDGKIISEVFESDGESFGLVTKEFEFKQEILAEGTVPSMQAAADIAVKNITITPEEGEEKTTLVYAFDLFAKVTVYEEMAYEAVTDMFSLGSEISTTSDYIEAKNYHSEINANDSVMLTANVANIENFDDVVGVFDGTFAPISVEDKGEKIVVTGLINTTALVKVAGTIETLKTENETYFEISKDASLILESISAFVNIVSYKVKAGKELEISARVTYNAKFDTEISERYVSSYEVVSQKPANEGGIKVYVTHQGETLFNVAKALSVRPEVITYQNEVSDVFEQGEKVYIYSPINLI